MPVRVNPHRVKRHVKLISGAQNIQKTFFEGRYGELYSYTEHSHIYRKVGDNGFLF